MKVLLSLLLASALLAESYPIALVDRPLTMPRNSFESTLRFDQKSLMQLGMGYGFSDNMQLGISWDGMEAPSGATPVPKRRINLTGAYWAFNSPYISGRANFILPFNFDRMVLQELFVGFALFVPVKRGLMNVVLFDQLMTLNWYEAETQATFHFPIRLSWQVNPAICLNFKTELAEFNTSGHHEHLIKKTPLYLEALYGITSEIDVIGLAGFGNIQNATNLSLMLGVNFRGGLEG
ncbi:MAG: hypothetical protein V4534_02120 [Myxococcota bacterium]